MACLVKRTNDDILIAQNFVEAPTYTLIVANMNAGSPVTDGWHYYADTRTRDSFPPLWKQPAGASDAYAKGFQVFYQGKIWESLIIANVWAPGVSGWREITTEDSSAPSWIQPTGAHDAYSKGAVVTYNSKLWQSTLDANVWAPGVAGWIVYSTLPPDAVSGYPAWVQPTGAGDAYHLNAIVSHNGQNWKNTGSDSNVWEPGVFGWVVI
jgi:hypothetical protein